MNTENGRDFGNGAWGKAAGITAAVGVGAGLMYLLDPNRGRARRARLRDQTQHTARVVREEIEKRWQGVNNRVQGWQAEMNRETVESVEPVSDQKIEGRVRARLGRVASHVHAIGVTANSGAVLLTGEAPARELCAIKCAAAKTPGVVSVENKITPLKGESCAWSRVKQAIPAVLGLGTGLAAGFQALRSRH